MRLLGNKILKFCECNRSKFARDWIVFGSEEGFDIFLSSHSEAGSRFLFSPVGFKSYDTGYTEGGRRFEALGRREGMWEVSKLPRRGGAKGCLQQRGDR